MQKKVIYDIGANNGDDIPYYVQKADLVVAIEANPVLAAEMRRTFEAEIAAERLVIENCVLTIEATASEVPFYIHRTNHVLSQLPRPHEVYLPSYDVVNLPSRNVLDMLARHGEPHYVKIDIEHYDQVILRELFAKGVKPPYISAELHSIDIFALMIALGDYEAFKLVDGASVVTKYHNHTIQTKDGPKVHSFPGHAAGPYGEDINGPWMTRDNMFRVLSYAGLGWKDIHASNVDVADPAYAPQPRVYVSMEY